MWKNARYVALNLIPASAVGIAYVRVSQIPLLALVTLSFWFLSAFSLAVAGLARGLGKGHLLIHSTTANMVWVAIMLRMVEFRLLNDYLQVMVLFSWVVLQAGAITRLWPRCGWLTVYLYLVGTASVVTIPKYAWKDPIEFTILLLNLGLFPLLLLGGFNYLRLLLGRRPAAAICVALLLVFLFPIRTFVKVFFDVLPPYSYVSPLALIVLVAAGAILGLKLPTTFRDDF